MVEQQATVVDVNGDLARISIERQSTCGGCASKSSCGTGVLGKMMGNKTVLMTVKNPLAAKIGDKVMIGIQEGLLLKGSFMAYSLPLILMMLGAYVGELLNEAYALTVIDLMQIVFGFLGFMLGMIWMRRFNKKLDRDPAALPQIVRNLSQPSTHIDVHSIAH